MKIQVLKAVVLLVSISAASVLIWNAARDEKPKEALKETPVELDDMQTSPKFGPVMSSDDIAEMAEEAVKTTVTDEEVKAMRESLLRSSKTGIIMSDDEIRKMLEEHGKVKGQVPSGQNLLRSSKSFSGTIIERGDLEKLLEGEKKQHLMPSSKSIVMPTFSKENMKKVIEGEKQESNKEQESSSQGK